MEWGVGWGTVVLDPHRVKGLIQLLGRRIRYATLLGTERSSGDGEPPPTGTRIRGEKVVSRKKKQKWVVGNVFLLPLKDGDSCLGQVIGR